MEKKARKTQAIVVFPSFGYWGDKRPKQPGNADGKKRGQQLDNTGEVKTEETVSPQNCQRCDRDLGNVPVSETEQRKKIDIIYEVVEHTVTSEVKVCPDCGTRNKGQVS